MTCKTASASTPRQAQNTRTAHNGKRLIALLTSTAVVSANALGAPAFAQSLPNALPTGGSVSAGSVTIGAPANGNLVINQTSGSAVLNWQSYNIGAGNTVTYIQPDANSAILNRVTGSTTTTIAGQLNANGQVYIVNPNGIAITSTGTINTGAFVASTLGISDDDFMAGRRTFAGNGASADVTNAGQITIARGGYMALIGGTVENAGTITVPMGKAALGSGEQATLDLSGNGFLQVAIPTNGTGTKALVSNSGRISASGGTVQLSAAAARNMARQAVNMSGTIEAKGVSGRSGDITLFGGDGEVHVSGRIDAGNAAGNGGKVTVTGRSVKLAGARVDASGKTGGGTVRIGGERKGAGTLKRADTLQVDAGTVINADAVSTGHGGDVVLWSDVRTSFAGTIFARGGAVSGNGGEVEVSSKARLSYTGLTDLTASNGSFGNLLLDPYNVTISTATDTGGFDASGDDSVINATTLTTALGAANVTVSTGASGTQAGTITVAAPLSWSAATTLTLNAASDIAIDAAITAPGGGLIVSASNIGTITSTAALNVGAFVLASGNWVQNAATLPSFSARDFRITDGASFLHVTGGDGSSATPYLLTDVYGLQGVGSSAGLRASNWALANSIDASGTATWNNGAGFNPIGDSFNAFTGSFDGQGRTISGLTINRPTTDFVGLFGTAAGLAIIRNIGLVGGSVTGGNYVGGLVGYHSGGVNNAYATGAVSGTNYVGGLVGAAQHVSMTNSYATGAVSGNDNVGGLVGFNDYSLVENSYATGAVSGRNSVGGLVGRNGEESSLTTVYASGAVSGNSSIGGLVGSNDGTVNDSFWDMDSTGQSTSAGGGTGLTTAQARQSSSYTGWDFSTGWYQAGDMRPILRSEAAVPVNNVATITNMHQLALINTNLSGSYVLGTDIDASATAGTNASGIWGAGGFVPIGNSNTSFAGAFDGQGHVITGLYINRPSIRDVGLFGYTDSFATIRNIGLAGGSVRGDSIVGGLVGNNYGAVSNVYATGAVSGGSDVGGLVGGNFGALSNVYASGAVSGNLFVGGLVGTNYGAVSNVYASGAVSGNVAVGGLVGNNYGALSNSYASGAVSGNHQVGGLVGSNYGGTVANSYASGAVSSRYDVSGLIGVSDGLVTDSFWNVDSTGQSTSSGGGTGLTTAQMNNPFTFIDAGWDFVSVWGTPKAGGAPVLRDLASDPVYTYYVRLSGNTTTTYGDTIETAGITLDGIGANRVSVGWGSAISATTNAGTYGYADANVVALNYGLGAEGDYFVDHGTGSLTIDRRTLTVTADAQSKTYGDVNPTLTYSTSGLVNGDTVTGSLGTSAGQYSGVGNYAITGSFTASSNYVLTYTGADLTVTPRSITVTADAQSKTYGDVNPVLTYTAAGLVNGDTLGGSLATFAGQYSNTGDYGIVLGTLMNSNYAISYTGANLTVGTRAVAVTADALSKSYGDVNPTMTYTATGLVNGDTLSGSLTTSAGRYSDVGVYAIGQGTLANGNYAINYTSANLTIGQRALSVMADAVSKTYGDMNPTLTYTATGLVNNDMLSGGLTTSTGQYSDVGTYGVTVGTLAASSNYALSYTGSTLTVTPKTISVVAGALFKTYGDVNPALTYTVSGLVNNDILSGSLTTSAGRYSDVGAYAIERGTLAASSNYVIDYAGANLTIGARSITVVADATSRLYGDVNPVFTYVATGLVNGDNLSGVLATAADAHSSAGSYAINQGTLANANYAISYTESNLTIGQRAITVTANNLKRYYGTANPPLTWTVGGLGLVNGDTLSGGLTTTATRTSSLGQYTIMQGTLMASANYAMTFNPATLTVAALLAMPSGASASSLGDSGKAFDMGRFAALPPVTGNGKQGADGSTILISDPRFAQTIVCVDDDVCAVAPRPTLH